MHLLGFVRELVSPAARQIQFRNVRINEQGLCIAIVLDIHTGNDKLPSDAASPPGGNHENDIDPKFRPRLFRALVPFVSEHADRPYCTDREQSTWSIDCWSEKAKSLFTLDSPLSIQPPNHDVQELAIRG